MQRCHAVPGKTSWIALEAPVGVVSDTDRVVDPPCAQRQQERLPAVVGLSVDGVEPRRL